MFFANFLLLIKQPRNNFVGLRQVHSLLEKQRWYESEIKPKLTFLQDHGISIKDFRQMLSMEPYFSQISVEDELKPIVCFFRSPRGTDTHWSPRLTSDQLRVVLLRQPLLFGSSLSLEILPKCEFFIKDMQLKPEELNHTIFKAPSLLRASLTALKERVYFFHNRSAEMHKIISILQKYPDLVDTPIPSLKRLHGFWKENVLLDRDFIIMIEKYPALLRLSVDKVLIPMLQYVIFMCRHRRGARLFISDPTLFEMSLDELAPKVEYLMRLGLGSKEFVSIVVNNPSILRLNLEREMKTRVQSLCSSGRLTHSEIAEILVLEPELLLRKTQIKLQSREQDNVNLVTCPIL